MLDLPVLRTARPLVPALAEVALPIVAYYLLHAVGVGDVLALSAGASLPGLIVLYKVVKDRKFDQMALFLMCMFGLGALLLRWTGDARLVLAKPSLFVVVAGFFCLFSLRRRPLMLTIARPMATKGDARLEKAWEAAWDQSPAFRQAIRSSTAVFGMALIIDALGRVVVAYSLPVVMAASLAQLPGIVALGLAIAYHVRRVKPVFQRVQQDLP